MDNLLGHILSFIAVWLIIQTHVLANLVNPILEIYTDFATGLIKLYPKEQKLIAKPEEE